MIPVLHAFRLSFGITASMNYRVPSFTGLTWLPLLILSALRDFGGKLATDHLIHKVPPTSAPTLPPTSTKIHQLDPPLPWLGPMLVLLGTLATILFLLSRAPGSSTPSPSPLPNDRQPHSAGRPPSVPPHIFGSVIASLTAVIRNLNHILPHVSPTSQPQRLTGILPSATRIARTAIFGLTTHKCFPTLVSHFWSATPALALNVVVFLVVVATLFPAAARESILCAITVLCAQVYQVADTYSKPAMIPTHTTTPYDSSFVAANESCPPTPLLHPTPAPRPPDDVFASSVVHREPPSPAAGSEDSLSDELTVPIEDARDIVRDWVEVMDLEDSADTEDEYQAGADEFLLGNMSCLWSDFVGGFAGVGCSTVRVDNRRRATVEGDAKIDAIEYPEHSSFLAGLFPDPLQEIEGRTILEMHSDVFEDEEYAKVMVEDVFELLAEERGEAVVVDIPEMLGLHEVAVTTVPEDASAEVVVLISDEESIETSSCLELVDDADADAPVEGETIPPVEPQPEAETPGDLSHVIDIQDSEELSHIVPPTTVSRAETREQDDNMLDDAPTVLVSESRPSPPPSDDLPDGKNHPVKLPDDVDADAPAEGEAIPPVEPQSEAEALDEHDTHRTNESLSHDAGIQECEELSVIVSPIADWGTERQVDMLDDAPTALVHERRPSPLPLDILPDGKDLLDASPANDSLPLLLPDGFVDSLLESQAEGLLEGSMEDSEDTDHGIEAGEQVLQPTSPATLEATEPSADSQRQSNDGHSTVSNVDATGFLFFTTEYNSILIQAIAPLTTPIGAPGLNIISPSPPTHRAITPPPSPYEFPAFLDSVPSASPLPSSSRSRPRSITSPEVRDDQENPDDTLDMGDILRQCDAYDNLLDATEDWPINSDMSEDWGNTPESLTKLEEMQVRHAVLLTTREQQAKTLAMEKASLREETSLWWEERYESLLDVVGEGMEEDEEDREEEVYGTPGMHAFLAIKKRAFAGINEEKPPSTPPPPGPPPACPLPPLPPSPV